MILYNWYESLALVWKITVKLFKGTSPKYGSVYTGHRGNSAKWPNGILICSADQRKTRVTNWLSFWRKVLTKNVSVIMFGWCLTYVWLYIQNNEIQATNWLNVMHILKKSCISQPWKHKKGCISQPWKYKMYFTGELGCPLLSPLTS